MKINVNGWWGTQLKHVAILRLVVLFYLFYCLTDKFALYFTFYVFNMGPHSYNPKTISTIITAMGNFSVQYNFQVCQSLILCCLFPLFYVFVGNSCCVIGYVDCRMYKY